MVVFFLGRLKHVVTIQLVLCNTSNARGIYFVALNGHFQDISNEMVGFLCCDWQLLKTKRDRQHTDGLYGLDGW